MLLAGNGRARVLVPISGALLTVVTVFGLIPELREQIGWGALILVAAGFLTLAMLDRAGVAVCPSCQHGTGVVGSLVTAIGIHAFVDGWAMTATGSASGVAVSRAIIGAMLIHKIPEGLAFGALLRVSSADLSRPVLLLIAAEGSTVIGGLCGLWAAPGIWMSYLLSLASGTFLFLGIHALDLRAMRRPARENSF